MIRGDWIKPGAVVIDVGTNRVAAGGGKTKLVGDVAFDEAKRGRGRHHARSGRGRADDDRDAAFERASRSHPSRASAWLHTARRVAFCRSRTIIASRQRKPRAASAKQLVDEAVERVEVGVRDRDLSLVAAVAHLDLGAQGARQARLEVADARRSSGRACRRAPSAPRPFSTRARERAPRWRARSAWPRRTVSRELFDERPPLQRRAARARGPPSARP